MENFSIQSVGNRAVITVDLSFMNIESLNRFFERLRAEQLIQKANFSDELAEIGAEIKENWWQKNREAYLEGIDDADRDLYQHDLFSTAGKKRSDARNLF